MSDPPQWLTDAFALAHPSALDPDDWHKAKELEASLLTEAREHLGNRRNAQAVSLAAMQRLSQLPDVLVCDRLPTKIDLFPLVFVDVAAWRLQRGTFSQDHLLQVDLRLVYVTTRNYEHLAWEFLSEEGAILQTLMNETLEDDLSRLSKWARLDPGRSMQHQDGYISAVLRYEVTMEIDR